MARVGVHPDVQGPRVRLGVLWFLVAMAAATAGRWSTGVLWAVVAAVAGRDVVRAWMMAAHDTTVTDSRVAEAGAVVGAAAVPLAAAYGTGLAGVVLIVVALGALVLGRTMSARGELGAASVVIGALLPAMVAASVVLTVRASFWAGLFLICAVSLYDAGAYLGGAESTSVLEGPVIGIVGALAATFTMAVFQAPPFTTATAWIAGGVVALACPVGQWVTSALLPSAGARARGMRRLDAYVLAAPLFLAGVWSLG